MTVPAALTKLARPALQDECGAVARPLGGQRGQAVAGHFSQYGSRLIEVWQQLRHEIIEASLIEAGSVVREDCVRARTENQHRLVHREGHSAR